MSFGTSSEKKKEYDNTPRDFTDVAYFPKSDKHAETFRIRTSKGGEIWLSTKFLETIIKNREAKK